MRRETTHEWLNHHLCPLHVYCRMRELHIWKPAAVILGKLYEWGFYRPFIREKC